MKKLRNTVKNTVAAILLSRFKFGAVFITDMFSLKVLKCCCS